MVLHAPASQMHSLLLWSAGRLERDPAAAAVAVPEDVAKDDCQGLDLDPEVQHAVSCSSSSATCTCRHILTSPLEPAGLVAASMSQQPVLQVVCSSMQPWTANRDPLALAPLLSDSFIWVQKWLLLLRTSGLACWTWTGDTGRCPGTWLPHCLAGGQGLRPCHPPLLGSPQVAWLPRRTWGCAADKVSTSRENVHAGIWPLLAVLPVRQPQWQGMDCSSKDGAGLRGSLASTRQRAALVQAHCRRQALAHAVSCDT